MSAARVEVRDGSILIRDLEIEDDRVAAFFAEADSESLDGLASRALIVGALSLERATMTANVDFLQKEVDGLVGNMRSSVHSFGKEILGKVGTDDDQVLAPLKKTLDTVKEDVEIKLKAVQDFLKDDLDPDSKTSKISRSLDEIRNLLDGERTDSIQGRLRDAVEATTKKDGALVLSVKEVVDESLKGVREEMNRLTLQIAGETGKEEGIQEIVEQTTKKGDPFERDVLEIIENWGAAAGVEVIHVGVDNQPGDIQLNFGPLAAGGESCRIIVETKDTGAAAGRKVIGDHMDERIAYRKCDAGVYIRKDESQYAKGIGGYAEGAGMEGPWVAATKDAIITAIRHARVLVHLQKATTGRGVVDVNGAIKGLEKIRHAVRQVNGLTRTANEIAGKAGDVRTMAEALRSTIKAAVSDVEDTLGLDHEPIDDSGDVEIVSREDEDGRDESTPALDGYAGLKK